MHLTVTCQVVGYRSVADRKPCVDFSLEWRPGGVENFRQFRALGGKWPSTLSTLRCIQMRQMFVYWSTTTSRAPPRLLHAHSPVTSLPAVIRHGSPPDNHVTPARRRSLKYAARSRVARSMLKLQICCLAGRSPRGSVVSPECR